jgi:protein-tyrosine phosphatase
VKVLMVCTGNICRSPMAEAVLRQRAADRGLPLEIDSAGVGGWHIGEPPDGRAVATLKRRGYDPGSQRARRATAEDIAAFDLILAMDRGHLSALRVAGGPELSDKVKLLMDYAPDAKQTEVPDPYYGGQDGFDHVLDLIEQGVDGLLEHLESRRATAPHPSTGSG